MWSYFWSVFSYIRTEYEDLLRKSPYSVANTGKYGPEITSYWHTFHAVNGVYEIQPLVINACS